MASLTKDELDDLAVENFRTYLRIPSVHPNVNYDDCKAFITKQAEEIGLPVTVFEFVTGKPILLLEWKGCNPDLPAILFNSHMDVVPAYPELWTHDPFGAEMDDNGDIYARGAQDMKCVSIQYLEAIRRLKLNGQKNQRTVYLSFVPDEEIGGVDGMKIFVTRDEFKSLNIGCAFDEGSASPTEVFSLFYGERTIWEGDIKIPGTEGHGSLLLKNTAGEKIRRLLDRLMDYRQSQVDILDQNPDLVLGDVTTVNLTILQGGVQVNVVPPEFVASIDMRIAIDVDLDDFERQLNTWLQESGDGLEIVFTGKDNFVEPTKLDDSNPYWVAMKQATDDMGLTLKPQIFFGGTDSRYIRELGIPAISFSPMNCTEPRLHANDEYLNKDIFLKGIEIYQNIITAVANVSG